MYKLNTGLLVKDYLKKQMKGNQSQKQIAKKLKIGSNIVWKLNSDKRISIKTFTKICEWLEENPEKYVVKQKVFKTWKEQKTI